MWFTGGHMSFQRPRVTQLKNFEKVAKKEFQESEISKVFQLISIISISIYQTISSFGGNTDIFEH